MFYSNITPMGNRILHRWVDDNGERHDELVGFAPELYIPSKKESIYTDIHGNPVSKVEFSSIKEARDFLSDYSDVSNMEIHGNQNWWAQFISENYPNDIEWDLSKLVIVNLDIENLIGDGKINPMLAANQVTAITIGVNKKQYISFSCVSGYKPKHKNVKHIECATEQELLHRFLSVWMRLNPDVITGWNIDGYDIPYLVNRIARVLGDGFVSMMAPAAHHLNKKYAVTQSYFSEGEYQLAGVSTLDYMKMYKKFTFKERESYKLDHITYVELGEKKLDYSEHSNLDDLYENDPHKYLDYNIRDVVLVDKLDDKLNLLMLVMTLTYKSKIPHDKVFSQVSMWDTFIYNELKKKNVVVPPKKDHVKDAKYRGAVVFDPKVGLHNWIVSFDLDSLYPHLMMQYNISPEVILDRKLDVPDVMKLVHKEVDLEFAKQDGVIIAANGAMFRKDKDGILPVLMESLYAERKAIKKKMLDAEQKMADTKGTPEYQKHENDYSKYKVMQLGIKVYLNSAYGMLGNEYSRYYDVRIAEAITVSGQLSIQWIQRKINDYLNQILKTENVDYIIAGDTDSIYFTLNPIVEKYGLKDKEKIVSAIDKFCQQFLEPEIDRAYRELADYMNARKQAMHMSREVIAARGFWRAKKNYALDVYNSEGVEYKNGKLKVMGIESVKSSTPEVCRDAINKSIEIILREDEKTLQAYVKGFRKTFMELPVEEIASPRSVNNIDDWFVPTGFKKRTPFHVAGSIQYNRMVNQLGIGSKYRLIKSGDKIKVIYLNKANPTFSHVIAFPDVLPPEFGLDRFIDREQQFEKTFLAPVESLCDLVGWTPVKINRLF